jgi:hypothetical protein
LLIAHDFEAFCEIAIDAFDDHGVVIGAGEDVAINLQQVNRLVTDAEEFAVLVQYNCVTESISKEYSHDGRCKGGSGCTSDWLHAGKAAHSATANPIAIRTFKAGMLAGRVCIKKHDEKWLREFRRLSTSRVG